MLVPSRYSADTNASIAPDKVWLVDLTDPTAPAYLGQRPFLTVRQDPYAVAVEDQLAFVLSPTDNAISVVDLRNPEITLFDPAPDGLLREAVFTDVDGSGSAAELVATELIDDEVPVSDTWTATWVPGTWRLWLLEGAGMSRWTWSDSGALVPSGFGVELTTEGTAFTAITDPWIVAGADGASVRAWIPNGDTIGWAQTSDQIGDWVYQAASALVDQPAWAAQLGGPSILDVGSRRLMYFDASADPTDPTDPTDLAGKGGVIGVATTADGDVFRVQETPAIEPGPGISALAQPSPIVDPFLGSVRAWMSGWDGARWVILEARSAEGTAAWSTPEVVLDLPGESVGAPHVEWVAGRYQMILSITVGGAASGNWWYATSTSADGIDWTPPALLEPVTLDAPPARPPRVGALPDPRLAWRFEGASTGPMVRLYTEGTAYSLVGAGAEVRVASGHVFGTRSTSLLAGGVEPGSVAELNGQRILFGSGLDADGVSRLVALRELGGEWTLASADLIPTGEGGNRAGARSPAVFPTPSGLGMLYAAAGADGLWRMRRATSVDGVLWTADEAPVLADAPSWAVSEQLPHAVEATESGWRAWFAGADEVDGRSRIGALVSADGVTWTLESEQAVLEPGEPGKFDDFAVRDPQPVACNGESGLWYSAFDGLNWSIGYATRAPGGELVRWSRPLDTSSVPVLSAVPGSFAAGGVRAPTLDPLRCELLFAGGDGATWRIGEAIVDGANLFPRLRFPTGGDVLTFDAVRGEAGTSVIDLGQTIDGFAMPGSTGALDSAGPTTMVVDSDRGLLFIAGKSTDARYPLPGVIVVDIRDDSTASWRDTNYLDVETFLWIETTTTALAVYDMALAEDDRLYLSASNPSAVWVVDTTSVEDNAEKELMFGLPAGQLPVHDVVDDAGETTFTNVAGAGIELIPEQGLLLVTHFKDNALSVFDLTLGTWGEEIRYIQDIGENPSIVRRSPDGTYAVIANYLGSVEGQAAGSSLLLLDLDPTSPSWLEITTRIVNR
jgi:hypothetical protein